MIELATVPGARRVAPQSPEPDERVDGSTSPRNDALPAAWGWALFALMAAASVGLAFASVTERQDEGILLTYPWLVAQGKMLYRAFWTLYPPSIFLVLAALVKAGVPGLVAERGLSVLARLGYVLLVNRVVNGSWRRFSFVAAPACFGLLALSSEARTSAFYVAIPIMLAGLVCVGRFPYWAAILFFVAGTFRYEMGIAGLAAMVVLAVLQALLRRVERAQLTATAALGLGLVGFYAALDLVTGGMAMREILVEPVRHLHRAIPLTPIQYFPWDLQLVALICLAPIGLALAGLVRRRPEVTASSVAMMLLLPYFLQRADRSHLYPLAALVIPWMLVSLQSLGARGWTWNVLRWWLALGVGFVEMVIVLSIAIYTSPVSPLSGPGNGPYLAGRGENVVLAASAQEGRDYRGLVTYLQRHATSRDRVFVWPSHMRYEDDNDPALYFALGMLPATSHLEINPGIESRADIQRQMVSQLAGSRWVVLWKPTFPGQQQWDNTAAPLVQRYVLRHYRPVMSNGSFEVLRAR